MTAVSGGIPNLVGGVSQQPPEIRAINTAAELKNTWSDVANGLSTRPCGEFVGPAGDAPTSDNTVATHDIQKPSGTYRITVRDGTITVTDLLDGSLKPVTVEGAAGDYINAPDAHANLGFLTVGDTTFIYNRSMSVLATLYDESGVDGISDGGVTRKNPNLHGTMWVKQRAGYKANYALYINGSRHGLVTTDVLTPAEIKTNLASGIAGFTTTSVSETVQSVTFNAETDYVNSHDDLANQAIFTYNDRVTEFTDLPNFDLAGRVVLIEQSLAEDADDYWVWYANGRWEETYGWDAKETLDASTMPHVLLDNGDGTWTLQEHTWDGRVVGDRDSNPTPSFVGRTINKMWVYKGRMCLLSDENFLASQVGRFENFYRSTCTQLLDDDPIDIASPNSKGALLGQAADFDGALLLFSQFDQFRVESGQEGLLSPNTVSIKRVNSYNNAVNVEVTYVGPNVIFVDDGDGRSFASLSEYQIERTFGREVAPSITKEVPELIPSGVYRIEASSTHNIMYVLSASNRRSLWLYNYYVNKEGKVQSAWQEWTFPWDIYGGGFVGDKLVLTVAYAGELDVLSFRFDNGADAVLDDESILLDWRMSSANLPVTFDGTDSFVTLPYTVQSEADLAQHLAVVAPSNAGPLLNGKKFIPYESTGDTLRFLNVDLTGNTFYIGWTYEFSWLLNPIYIRDRNLVAIQDSRLQLRSVSFLYSASGPFEVRVQPKGRDVATKINSGFLVGGGDDVLNTFSFDSGSFRVGAYGNAATTQLRVVGETPWRVRFSSVEWAGSYRPKRRRTT